ncbi:unnamed protein product [Pseudo-nitzschia multistriata]|uniref:Bestrophin homolog n=1 Tax=Pseudo-nitzschia multistriata TaxID=183589 RepID=A0A448YU56_9STRA|nr:unnamed protein product [Pseudo-nitzschia multistriata]
MMSSCGAENTTATVLPLHGHHINCGQSPSQMPSKHNGTSKHNKTSETGEHKRCYDGNLSHKKNDRNKNKKNDNDRDNNNYFDFPLVQSMVASESSRTRALCKEGSKQMSYPKSNTGWIRTLFVFEGRALGRILLPWSVVTSYAIVWAVVYETFLRQPGEGSTTGVREKNFYIESMLELVISTTLGFLLVFRLNRSATRFWMARGCWGVLVVKIRAMVGTVLLYGSHDSYHRDQVIKWITAFSIVSMNHMRGISRIDPETVGGLQITPDELDSLGRAFHPPLHVADQIRFHLGALFGPESIGDIGGNNSINNNKSETDLLSHRAAIAITVSDFRSKQLLSLEEQLNIMIDEEGAMERIKGTPLPMVYVTHLRTWLLVFLLSQSHLRQQALGPYLTVALVSLMAFALLGLEGAAAEVEAPFRRDKTNHLDMDSFCLAVLASVQQQITEDANRRTARAQQKASGD